MNSSKNDSTSQTSKITSQTSNMSVQTSNMTVQLSDQVEYIIGKQINLYYPPILSFVGLCGNVIAFLVYSQRHVRISSTAIYLTVLALFDSLMLLVGLMQYWLLFNFFPKSLTKEHCYGMFFVVNSLGNFTHWLIVTVTIDRFIAVVFPMKRAMASSPRVAYRCIASVGVFAVLKNVHYIWTTDFTYHTKSGNAMCAFGLVRKGTDVEAYQWFETMISSLIPFGVILTANLCIIFTLRKKSSDLAKRYNPTTRNSRRVFNLNEDKGLTVLLIIVSTAFVILTCPLLVVRLYFAKIDFKNDVRLNAIYNLLHHVTHKLWYTNNGVNFFIYSCFGKKFRKDFLTLWRRVRACGGGCRRVQDVHGAQMQMHIQTQSHTQSQTQSQTQSESQTQIQTQLQIQPQDETKRESQRPSIQQQNETQNQIQAGSIGDSTTKIVIE